MSVHDRRDPGPPAHHHAVAFFESDDALRQMAGQYVHDGLTDDETVMAVVTPRTEQLLRDALGTDAARVEWATGISYRALGTMFADFRSLLAEQRAAGSTVRLLSEYDGYPGSDTASEEHTERLAAYLRLEAVSNEVWAPFAHRWACFYDTRTYPEPLRRRIAKVHTVTLDDSGQAAVNAEYLEPADYLDAHPDRPAPAPRDADVALVLDSVDQLRDLRGALRTWTAGLGVDTDGTDRVLLAAGEVATNALQHGRPPANVVAWRTAEAIRIRVENSGDGAVDARRGHRPPADGGPGAGLWLARTSSDTLRIDSEGGTVRVDLAFVLPR